MTITCNGTGLGLATIYGIVSRVGGEVEKVLFTSGYTDDAVVRSGVESDRVPFLQKPFAPADLTRAVRELLISPLEN